MNGINEFGLNEFLGRRLNINDSPAPAGTLAPEVMPIIDALPRSQEDDYLRGIRHSGAVGIEAAVALNYSMFTLENPSNSGLLVLVDQCIISVGDVNALSLHYCELTSALDVVGAVGTAVRDTRWPVATGSRTQALFRYGVTPNAPGITLVPWGGFQWTGETLTIRPEITLRPGTSYHIRSSIVNTALGLTLIWRERPAQPSELG